MKKMVYGAMAALALVATGCTGSFQLMQGIHKWHTGFENSWVDELCYVFPGLLLYGAAWMVDTVAFNSMEFWLGTNPVQVQVGNYTVDRVGDNVAMVRDSATGAVYTMTRAADGTLTLADAQGHKVTAEIQGSILKMTAADGTVRTALR